MRIGLTGTIGSGKTVVADMLRGMGAHVLDADEAARALTARGAPLCDAIRERWGDCVFLPDGALDRRKLAEIVFSNDAERAALDSLIHPAVYDRLEREAEAIIRAEPDAVVFFDIPLLIETGQDARMDAVWLVAADDEARIARVTARDGTTRSDVKMRIASQMPQAEKMRHATAIIDNSGDMAALRLQVERLYRRVISSDEV